LWRSAEIRCPIGLSLVIPPCEYEISPESERCRVHAAEDFKEADPAELAAMAADMRSGTRRRRVLPVRFGGRDGWLKIALDEGWRKRVGRGAPGKALLRELAVIESRRA